MACSACIFILLPMLYTHLRSQSNGCSVNLGTYHGPLWRTSETLSEKCILSSKWLRVSEHIRRVSEDIIIPDWLWIDYHDRVNVLVFRADTGKWAVFSQSKYALEGQSYAVVGGLIEPGETAESAARREVLEEMHLDVGKLKNLGRFRTDVNRGLGWVTAFLAMDCVPSKQRRPSDDPEKQVVHSIDTAQLRTLALAGRFVEVQWSNTVSLALLHISEGEELR